MMEKVGLEEVSVKAEPLLEHECLDEESSFLNVCVVDEPSCSNVYIKDEPSCLNVYVKDELASSEPARGVSAVAQLYADHVVKDELVLGPELVQPPRVFSATSGTFCHDMSE
jgi:hypothetical protein